MSETLTARHRVEIEVRKSRFVAQAAPVDSSDAALAYLREVADASATHNCWAFRVGDQYRSSDDGEPGGTAGRPILTAIDGQGVDRVMVVVTRWYGGIKLGAGGLVRAYGGAAAECLRTAARVAIVAHVLVHVRCGFGEAGAVRNVATLHGGECIGEAFDADGVVLRIDLPESARPDFAAAVRDATRGKAVVALPPG